MGSNSAMQTTFQNANETDYYMYYTCALLCRTNASLWFLLCFIVVI